ncbi:MAG: tripartite tricarboxylate transporter permease [Alphaproteobacteria bacterium]|jgi:putative tricarboxylic transport membrane protein|nr:tripartite tricarboxylate transporter permease [Alphaproteobacteria bacterium]
MELDALIKGFTLIASPMNVGLIFIAVVIGVLVGALPGLSSSMAVALLLPLTIGMEPIPAICMMAALYCAGTFGGSITAILINAPGAPPAVATAFDGYPLAQRGEAGRALGIAVFSSVIGGIISLLIFIVAAPALSAIATSFRHVEYFALALFGLSMLATISGRSSLRNLIAGAFGVLIGTVGMHIATGVKRFVPFDIYMLEEGIGFVPVLIGLFAFAELLNQSGKLEVALKLVKELAVRLPSKADFIKVKGAIGRSSIIGTIIGILPAEGATVAAIIGYNEAKRWSKNPEEFGKGSIEGIAGPEAANNAATGGAMVPTLALGIPGSGTTAIILVALMMHGFRPGPYLIRETPEFVYAIFGSMLMANVMFFFLGMVGAKVFARVTLIPRTFLWPVVLVFSVVGSYALNQSPFDVYVMLISGVLGYVMLRHGFGPAPFVMGLILGRLVEDNWSNAMVFYDHEMIRFLESPIVVAFLLMSLITLFWIPLTNAAKKIRATNVESVSDD